MSSRSALAALLAGLLAAEAVSADPAVHLLVQTRSGLGFVHPERGTLVEMKPRHSFHSALGLLGDCSRIALVAPERQGPGHRNEIFVFDRRDLTRRQLTWNLGARSLALSPGGDRLAFVSGVTGELHMVDVRTGRATPLTSELGGPGGDGPRVGAPAWSPDGSRIAFPWEDRGKPTWQSAIFVLDLETGERRAVLDPWPSGLAGHSPWSPDGRQLALNAPIGDFGGSVIVSLDERPARVVETFENVDHVSWSPDGAFLALVDSTDHCGSIRIRDQRTGRETAVTGGLFEYRCFDPPSWSPDSRHLAFTAYSSRGDMNPFPWPPYVRGQLYVSAVPEPARRLTEDLGERTVSPSWCAGPPPPDPADTSRLRRTRLLQSSPTELAIEPMDGVWGVLMDLSSPHGTATLVALADGTASLYLSRGGAVLGVTHPPIAAAARRMVALARSHLDELSPTSEFPLPPAGEIRFYVLTTRGVLTAGAPRPPPPEHPLAELYAAGQEVITGLRERSQVHTR